MRIILIRPFMFFPTTLASVTAPTLNWHSSANCLSLAMNERFRPNLERTPTWSS